MCNTFSFSESFVFQDDNEKSSSLIIQKLQPKDKGFASSGRPKIVKTINEIFKLTKSNKFK